MSAKGISRFLFFLAVVVATAQSDFTHSDSTIVQQTGDVNAKGLVDESRILPVRIYKSEGIVWNAEAALHSADSGVLWGIGAGGMVAFEFAEIVAGRVCFEVNRIKPNNIDLATDPCTILLSYSKSPSFTRRKPDGLDGRPAQTLPAKVPIKHKGLTCVENASDGGAFKYLMVSIAEGQAEAETQPANIGSSESQSLSENMLRPYRLLIQKLLAWGQHTAYGPNLPAVEISAMFVDCTDFSATLHEQGNTEASDASSLSSSTTVDVDKTKPRISSRQTGLEDDKSAKDNAMIADLKHWFAAQESRYVIKLQKHAKNLMMVLDVKTASIREWMSALRSSTEYAIADFKASEAQMNKQIRAGLDANRASAKRRRVEADAQNIKGTPDL